MMQDSSAEDAKRAAAKAAAMAAAHAAPAQRERIIAEIAAQEYAKRKAAEQKAVKQHDSNAAQHAADVSEQQIHTSDRPQPTAPSDAVSHTPQPDAQEHAVASERDADHSMAAPRGAFAIPPPVKPRSGNAAAAKEDTSTKPTLVAAADVYSRPSWAGKPEGVPYTLEILKSGTSLGVLDVCVKDHYVFGRQKDCDVVLEHPTASRVHAIIQYNGDTNEAFLYDCGSTHKTFLNKREVKPNVHVPIRVGDMIKFGQSTRLYVFGGPADMMPTEGPNRQQRHAAAAQHAAAEAAAKRRAREQEVAKTQMEAALSGGALWGMAHDDAAAADMAADMAAANGADVDWRAYRDTHGLNEKQQAIAEKVRRKEWKINNLKNEVQRIRNKESQGELTASQAATIVRNEQVIEKLEDELEELEEHLKESVGNSMASRRAAAAKQPKRAAKRKAQRDSDDEYADNDDDDDDDFYDRTATNQKRKVKQKEKKAAHVETAETAWGKRAVLTEEVDQLRAAVLAEQQSISRRSTQPPSDASTARNGTDAAASSAAAAAGEQDSLDEYLASMSNDDKEKKLKQLQKELAEAEEQLQRADRLFKIIDPDGWYQPSAAAAEAAKSKARKLLHLNRQRAAFEEQCIANKLAAKAKQNEEVVPEVDDEGPAEAAMHAATTSPARAAQHSTRPQLLKAPKLALRAQPQPASRTATVASHTAATSSVASSPQSPSQPPLDATAQQPVPSLLVDDSPQHAHRAENTVAQHDESASAATKAQHGALQSGGTVSGDGGGNNEGRVSIAGTSSAAQQRDNDAALHAKQMGNAAQQATKRRGLAGFAAPSAAAAAVEENMKLLQQAEHGLLDDDYGGGDGNNGVAHSSKVDNAKPDAATWQPPKGQTGDGRTKLNDLFGY